MAQGTSVSSSLTLVEIIRTYIIDNDNGAVNPKKLRTVLEAIANSVTASSGTAISATPPLNFDAFTNVFSLPVINDLVTGGGNVPLSAEQGVELKKLIDAVVVNMTLFPTTADSDITDYVRMVTSMDDADYDDTAVNVPTGAITGADVLVSELATDAGVIFGGSGIVNIQVIGKIRKVSGTANGQFYYEVYKRNLAGTETLLATSDATEIVSSNVYVEFSASAVWSNTDGFISTDRIVYKFYGSKSGSGSNPSFEFEFGGATPVRSIVPVAGSAVTSLTDKIYAIARIDTGGLGSWYKIDDADHQPSANTQEVLTDPATGYNFAINHNNGYDKVGYVQATIDETYTSMGLLVGPSVGKGQSLFRVCRNGFSVSLQGGSSGITFGDDTGQLVKPDDFVASFNTATSMLTITHANIKCTYGDMGLLTAVHPCPYTFRFVSRTDTTSIFYIMNNGVPVTTALGTLFKAIYTKLGTFIMQNRHFASSGGNIWIEGEFPV